MEGKKAYAVKVERTGAHAVTVIAADEAEAEREAKAVFKGEGAFVAKVREIGGGEDPMPF